MLSSNANIRQALKFNAPSFRGSFRDEVEADVFLVPLLSGVYSMNDKYY